MDADGNDLKGLWPLQPDMIFLNHGSYGATPHAVLAEQARWRDQLESQPCQFINAVAPDAIRAAAARLAGFLAAAAADLAFVENTTAGINAILKSLTFAEGDEVVVSDHVYNAVRNTLRFVLDPVGARLVVAEVGMPVTDDAAITEAINSAVTDRTRLIVVDHIASVSAVIFPVAQIAKEARARGIPILVDGAHAPGMVDLDIPSLGVDWYVGNCHKWLCAPKGSAFVWAAPVRQEGLHPTVISHDLGKGWTFEFDKVGTRDSSAWLSVPAALDFHTEHGGAELRARNHRVVVAAAQRLAAQWGTETGAPDTMFGAMATIRAPGNAPADRSVADAMKRWLWEKHRAEVHVMPFCGALWVRLSVQIYNTPQDCDAVGPLVAEAVSALT